ncbi:MAG: FecR domain-containing protein [Mediterranea sp.]|jgi:ferric-dicitrate binding protein FerR (iron transport regulator)|nr:FecR domain-containing protein [Mediterranea sp.]
MDIKEWDEQEYIERWNDCMNAEIPQDINTELAFRQVEHKIMEMTADEQLSEQPATLKRWNRNPLYWSAACLVCLLLAGGHAFYRTAYTTEPEVSPPTVGVPHEMLTVDARQQEVSFPDGSTVWTHDDTRLTYYDNRSVKLSGEAYFEVKQGVEQSFKVLADDVCITVTGTKFNVNHPSGTLITTVTLYEGSLHIVNDDLDFLLRSNQCWVYDHGAGTSRIDTVKDALPAWVANTQLSFQRISLKKLTEVISRYYPLQFKYEPSIGEEEVRLKLHGNESIDEILMILSVISPKLKFQRQGDIVTIKRTSSLGI